MKEYKYKINGNEYKVTVGDIDNNVAQIEVNGVPYKVELEEKAAAKPVVKTGSRTAHSRRCSGNQQADHIGRCQRC